MRQRQQKKKEQSQVQDSLKGSKLVVDKKGNKDEVRMGSKELIAFRRELQLSKEQKSDSKGSPDVSRLDSPDSPRSPRSRTSQKGDDHESPRSRTSQKADRRSQHGDRDDRRSQHGDRDDRRSEHGDRDDSKRRDIGPIRKTDTSGSGGQSPDRSSPDSRDRSSPNRDRSSPLAASLIGRQSEMSGSASPSPPMVGPRGEKTLDRSGLAANQTFSPADVRKFMDQHSKTEAQRQKELQELETQRKEEHRLRVEEDRKRQVEKEKIDAQTRADDRAKKQKEILEKALRQQRERAEAKKESETKKLLVGVSYEKPTTTMDMVTSPNSPNMGRDDFSAISGKDDQLSRSQKSFKSDPSGKSLKKDVNASIPPPTTKDPAEKYAQPKSMKVDAKLDGKGTVGKGVDPNKAGTARTQLDKDLWTMIQDQDTDAANAKDKENDIVAQMKSKIQQQAMKILQKKPQKSRRHHKGDDDEGDKKTGGQAGGQAGQTGKAGAQTGAAVAKQIVGVITGAGLGAGLPPVSQAKAALAGTGAVNPGFTTGQQNTGGLNAALQAKAALKKASPGIIQVPGQQHSTGTQPGSPTTKVDEKKGAFAMKAEEQKSPADLKKEELARKAKERREKMKSMKTEENVMVEPGSGSKQPVAPVHGLQELQALLNKKAAGASGDDDGHGTVGATSAGAGTPPTTTAGVGGAGATTGGSVGTRATGMPQAGTTSPIIPPGSPMPGPGSASPKPPGSGTGTPTKEAPTPPAAEQVKAFNLMTDMLTTKEKDDIFEKKEKLSVSSNSDDDLADYNARMDRELEEEEAKKAAEEDAKKGKTGISDAKSGHEKGGKSSDERAPIKDPRKRRASFQVGSTAGSPGITGSGRRGSSVRRGSSAAGMTSSLSGASFRSRQSFSSIDSLPRRASQEGKDRAELAKKLGTPLPIGKKKDRGKDADKDSSGMELTPESGPHSTPGEGLTSSSKPDKDDDDFGVEKSLADEFATFAAFDEDGDDDAAEVIMDEDGRIIKKEGGSKRSRSKDKDGHYADESVAFVSDSRTKGLEELIPRGGFGKQPAYSVSPDNYMGDGLRSVHLQSHDANRSGETHKPEMEFGDTSTSSSPDDSSDHQSLIEGTPGAGGQSGKSEIDKKKIKEDRIERKRKMKEKIERKVARRIARKKRQEEEEAEMRAELENEMAKDEEKYMKTMGTTGGDQSKELALAKQLEHYKSQNMKLYRKAKDDDSDSEGFPAVPSDLSDGDLGEGEEDEKTAELEELELARILQMYTTEELALEENKLVKERAITLNKKKSRRERKGRFPSESQKERINTNKTYGHKYDVHFGQKQDHDLLPRMQISRFTGVLDNYTILPDDSTNGAYCHLCRIADLVIIATIPVYGTSAMENIGSFAGSGEAHEAAQGQQQQQRKPIQNKVGQIAPTAPPMSFTAAHKEHGGTRIGVPVKVGTGQQGGPGGGNGVANTIRRGSFAAKGIGTAVGLLRPRGDGGRASFDSGMPLNPGAQIPGLPVGLPLAEGNEDGNGSLGKGRGRGSLLLPNGAAGGANRGSLQVMEPAAKGAGTRNSARQSARGNSIRGSIINAIDSSPELENLVKNMNAQNGRNGRQSKLGESQPHINIARTSMLNNRNSMLNLRVSQTGANMKLGLVKTPGLGEVMLHDGNIVTMQQVVQIYLSATGQKAIMQGTGVVMPGDGGTNVGQMVKKQTTMSTTQGKGSEFAVRFGGQQTLSIEERTQKSGSLNGNRSQSAGSSQRKNRSASPTAHAHAHAKQQYFDDIASVAPWGNPQINPTPDFSPYGATLLPPNVFLQIKSPLQKERSMPPSLTRGQHPLRGHQNPKSISVSRALMSGIGVCVTGPELTFDEHASVADRTSFGSGRFLPGLGTIGGGKGMAKNAFISGKSAWHYFYVGSSGYFFMKRGGYFYSPNPGNAAGFLPIGTGPLFDQPDSPSYKAANYGKRYSRNANTIIKGSLIENQYRRLPEPETLLSNYYGHGQTRSLVPAGRGHYSPANPPDLKHKFTLNIRSASADNLDGGGGETRNLLMQNTFEGSRAINSTRRGSGTGSRSIGRGIDSRVVPFGNPCPQKGSPNSDENSRFHTGPGVKGLINKQKSVEYLDDDRGQLPASLLQIGKFHPVSSEILAKALPQQVQIIGRKYLQFLDGQVGGGFAGSSGGDGANSINQGDSSNPPPSTDGIGGIARKSRMPEANVINQNIQNLTNQINSEYIYKTVEDITKNFGKALNRTKAKHDFDVRLMTHLFESDLRQELKKVETIFRKITEELLGVTKDYVYVKKKNQQLSEEVLQRKRTTDVQKEHIAMLEALLGSDEEILLANMQRGESQGGSDTGHGGGIQPSAMLKHGAGGGGVRQSNMGAITGIRGTISNTGVLGGKLSNMGHRMSKQTIHTAGQRFSTARSNSVLYTTGSELFPDQQAGQKVNDLSKLMMSNGGSLALNIPGVDMNLLNSALQMASSMSAGKSDGPSSGNTSGVAASGAAGQGQMVVPGHMAPGMMMMPGQQQGQAIPSTPRVGGPSAASKPAGTKMSVQPDQGMAMPTGPGTPSEAKKLSKAGSQQTLGLRGPRTPSAKRTLQLKSTGTNSDLGAIGEDDEMEEEDAQKSGVPSRASSGGASSGGRSKGKGLSISVSGLSDSIATTSGIGLGDSDASGSGMSNDSLNQSIQQVPPSMRFFPSGAVGSGMVGMSGMGVAMPGKSMMFACVKCGHRQMLHLPPGVDPSSEVVGVSKPDRSSAMVGISDGDPGESAPRSEFLTDMGILQRDESGRDGSQEQDGSGSVPLAMPKRTVRGTIGPGVLVPVPRGPDENKPRLQSAMKTGKKQKKGIQFGVNEIRTMTEDGGYMEELKDTEGNTLKNEAIVEIVDEHGNVIPHQGMGMIPMGHPSMQGESGMQQSGMMMQPGTMMAIGGSGMANMSMAGAAMTSMEPGMGGPMMSMAGGGMGMPMGPGGFGGSFGGGGGNTFKALNEKVNTLTTQLGLVAKFTQDQKAALAVKITSLEAEKDRFATRLNALFVDNKDVIDKNRDLTKQVQKINDINKALKKRHLARKVELESRIAELEGKLSMYASLEETGTLVRVISDEKMTSPRGLSDISLLKGVKKNDGDEDRNKGRNKGDIDKGFKIVPSESNREIQYTLTKNGRAIVCKQRHIGAVILNERSNSPATGAGQGFGGEDMKLFGGKDNQVNQESRFGTTTTGVDLSESIELSKMVVGPSEEEEGKEGKKDEENDPFGGKLAKTPVLLGNGLDILFQPDVALLDSSLLREFALNHPNLVRNLEVLTRSTSPGSRGATPYGTPYGMNYGYYGYQQPSFGGVEPTLEQIQQMEGMQQGIMRPMSAPPNFFPESSSLGDDKSRSDFAVGSPNSVLGTGKSVVIGIDPRATAQPRFTNDVPRFVNDPRYTMEPQSKQSWFWGGLAGVPPSHAMHGRMSQTAMSESLAYNDPRYTMQNPSNLVNTVGLNQLKNLQTQDTMGNIDGSQTFEDKGASALDQSWHKSTMTGAKSVGAAKSEGALQTMGTLQFSQHPTYYQDGFASEAGLAGCATTSFREGGGTIYDGSFRDPNHPANKDTSYRESFLNNYNHPQYPIYPPKIPYRAHVPMNYDLNNPKHCRRMQFPIKDPKRRFLYALKQNPEKVVKAFAAHVLTLAIGEAQLKLLKLPEPQSYPKQYKSGVRKVDPISGLRKDQIAGVKGQVDGDHGRPVGKGHHGANSISPLRISRQTANQGVVQTTFGSPTGKNGKILNAIKPIRGMMKGMATGQSRIVEQTVDSEKLDTRQRLGMPRSNGTGPSRLMRRIFLDNPFLKAENKTVLKPGEKGEGNEKENADFEKKASNAHAADADTTTKIPAPVSLQNASTWLSIGQPTQVQPHRPHKAIYRVPLTKHNQLLSSDDISLFINRSLQLVRELVVEIACTRCEKELLYGKCEPKSRKSDGLPLCENCAIEMYGHKVDKYVCRHRILELLREIFRDYFPSSENILEKINVLVPLNRDQDGNYISGPADMIGSHAHSDDTKTSTSNIGTNSENAGQNNPSYQNGQGNGQANQQFQHPYDPNFAPNGLLVDDRRADGGGTSSEEDREKKTRSSSEVSTGRATPR